MTSSSGNLRTARLVLVPATLAHLQAELEGNATFAELIRAEVPNSWPPGEYDRGAQQFFRERLESEGEAAVGWYGWYAVRASDHEHSATVVAGAGYFGRPTDDGVVEIGYSVCPEWQGHGYATETVRALAAHAMQTPQVTLVIAHTTPENLASVAVLERAGFSLAGRGEHEGTIRFERRRRSGDYAVPPADADPV